MKILFKKIECCSDCPYYIFDIFSFNNKCALGAHEEKDKRDPIYDDCPLEEYKEDAK